MRKKQSRENAYCQETVRYRIIKLNEKAFRDLGSEFVVVKKKYHSILENIKIERQDKLKISRWYSLSKEETHK